MKAIKISLCYVRMIVHDLPSADPIAMIQLV